MRQIHCYWDQLKYDSQEEHLEEVEEVSRAALLLSSDDKDGLQAKQQERKMDLK